VMFVKKLGSNDGEAKYLYVKYFAQTFNSADSEGHYDFKEVLHFCWLNGNNATPIWWLICGSHRKEMNIFAVECHWY
ncbi:Sister chromatid cohesion protein PDS5-like protein A, partial [Frankliniella fusca]